MFESFKTGGFMTRDEKVDYLVDESMSSQHTPGPWAVHTPTNAAFTRHPPIMSDTGEIAKATWAGSERETDSNARLIAAAPDLLIALEACLHRLAHHDDQSVPECEMAQAAIAKAVGSDQ
jgi:hypothetical protein